MAGKMIITPTKIEELEELVSQLVGEETSEDDIFFIYITCLMH